jgi:hypothetical protein
MDQKITKENPYCKKCGNDLPSNADFCPACGETTHKSEISYIKPNKGGTSGGQVVAILLGGFLILIAIPFLAGGSALLGVNSILDQGSDYIGVDNVDMYTSTQVLVAKELDIRDLDIDNDDEIPRWVMENKLGDLVTIRISADSHDGKDVFIGIVEEADALEYLSGIEYDYINNFQMETYNDPDISYRRHSGDEVTTLPTDLDIWVAETSGPGEQTLTWSPDTGNYWMVIMNEDASQEVDIETGFAVKVPIIGNIGGGLFFGGFVAMTLGVAIVYYGAIKPRA